VILTDANVPMYAAGADHPNKPLSVAFLNRVAEGEIEAAIDTETLREILHRYRALHRWEDADRVYELARTIFPDVFPVTADVSTSILIAFRGVCGSRFKGSCQPPRNRDYGDVVGTPLSTQSIQRRSWA